MTIAFVLIVLIITLFLFGIILALVKHENNFDAVEDLITREVANTIGAKRQMENMTTIHNVTVTQYDQEFDEITKKLEDIAKDIGRLDAEMKYQQARMNVVYPWFENSKYNTKKNGGVEWAGKIRSSEDL